MGVFVEHHRGIVRFVYSCFDRVLFNVFVPAWQCAAVLVGLLTRCHGVQAISRAYLRSVSQEYHRFVQSLAERETVPIVTPPKGVRRDEWVAPFYRRLHGRPGIAVILKSREAARIAVSYATRSGGHHIELYQRFVQQYYFYIQDAEFGRLFIRMCPYLPFNARLLINGHEWLACQMRREGIRFRQHANAFLTCSDPQRLQQLADGFSAQHIIALAQRWLARLAPPLMDAHERRAARDYRLFFSQTEYCNNLIFRRRAPLDQLAERLLDHNRGIGRPDKLALIFGRRVSRRTPGGFQTQILDHHLGNPVIRTQYKDQSVKQYVRDHLLLRTEETCYNTRDLGIGKALENLPVLRDTLRQINERYLDAQQDVLESFLDRGQLEWLTQPALSPSGRRIPGLKIHDARQLAVMRALVRFANLANQDSFRTRDLLEDVGRSLGKPYTLTQLRYDLSKLRAKGLVVRIKKTQRYRLTPAGFRICVLLLKLSDRLYKPLVAAAHRPILNELDVPPERHGALDRRYAAIDHAINDLLAHIGLKAA
jgi:hypothetical protein